MSVGLTLQDNKVNVIFLDDGVYLLTDLKPEIINSPEIDKHIETLISFNMDLLVDKESVDKRGIKNIKYNVKVVSSNEILNTIRDSEVIISY
jgi:sulfur relay (sulfurtransferase) DsrF/TusC family protein